MTIRWNAKPTLRRPALVAAFSGWNDAADAASDGVRWLARNVSARVFATLDTEEYLDFQAARPTVELVDGVIREIQWPALAFSAGSVPGGRDLRAEGFRVICWTPCSIQDDGRAAREAVKAHVARVLKRDLPFALDTETVEAVRKIRAEYEYYRHMMVGTEHGHPVPDALVEKFAVAGTPAEARAQRRCPSLISRRGR